MDEIRVPVSPGELIDKITILRIKAARIADPAKLANVRLELARLEEAWAQSPFARADVHSEEAALLAVNERLWVIEDDIRGKERVQAFDAEFIRLARAVYFENDERADVKRRINVKLGSQIVEEKSYAGYGRNPGSGPAAKP